MSIEERSCTEIRIGDKGIEELEYMMREALAPLLGEDLQIEITRIVRCDDVVTSLEIKAEMAKEEEETAFAFG